MSLIELNVDRSRQRVFAIKLVDDFRVGSRLAEILQSLILRGEGYAFNAIVALNGLHYLFDVGIARIVLHIRRNGNLVLNRGNHVVHHSTCNAEDADDQQRQENRDDRAQRSG